jgi:hypothetical protein
MSTLKLNDIVKPHYHNPAQHKVTKVFTSNNFYFGFQSDIMDRLLIFEFLCVGSMLGLDLELLPLALFSEVRVPGCVAEDDDDLRGDVSVELHVVLLSGSQSSAETHFQELTYIIYM